MSSRLCIRIGGLAVTSLMIAGCDTLNQNNISPDPGFGEAVKYNAAIQTIDPDPVYGPDDAQPGESGAKGAEAVKRYRTDQVKDVEQITTTASGSGGPQ